MRTLQPEQKRDRRKLAKATTPRAWARLHHATQEAARLVATVIAEMAYYIAYAFSYLNFVLFGSAA